MNKKKSGGPKKMAMGGLVKGKPPAHKKMKGGGYVGKGKKDC